jgi:hypothetical protein
MGWAAVPETTIDKYGDALAGKNEIGSTEKFLIASPSRNSVLAKLSN